MTLSDLSRQLKPLAESYPLFAKTLLKIRTKSGEIKPFKFNRIQSIIDGLLEQQLKETGRVRALILKGRQQGCSTYVGGRYYHKTTHNRGIRTFILTHEQEATANLFAMVERYHDLMPLVYRPSLGASNRKELLFDVLDSGYRIGTAGTKGVGRSATIQLFHGSEVAFWPHADTHAAGILQAVPKESGTEIILESTANGLGNFFHKIWQQAEVGASEYQAIFIPWYYQEEYQADPEPDFEPDDEELKYQSLYDLDLNQIVWRRKKIIELGDPLLFKQEYPATAAEAFQTTGIESFIKSDDVIRARKRKPYDTHVTVIAGYDPARQGDDRDAFIYRQGLNAFGLEYKDYKTFPEKVAYCLEKLNCKDPYITKLFIDYGGAGWEIAGMLKEAGFEDRISVVNFGTAALKDQSYANKRAEMYGELNKWLTDSQQPPSIPDDNALHADLTAASYSYDSKTRLKLEKKAEIKKRFLRSPDGADALALTFAFPIGQIIKRKMVKPIPTKSFF